MLQLIMNLNNVKLIYREANKKHVEFAGRRNLGEIAKLYIKIEAKQEEVV